MDVSEILSVFSIVISRFFSNIHSFFLLFILKLRGMKGGRGLRIHSTVTMCDWHMQYAGREKRCIAQGG